MAIPAQEFPQAFGKYTLLKKLARGGMAELFLARMAGSPRLYVIKRILPDMAMDRQFLSMFLTEARVAAQLVHPNIINIYDLGREGTHFYLSMEYIDGIDLEHLVKLCGGKIPPDVMARICIDLCDALHFANRSIDMSTGKPLNVIHRDVTPGNVMITRQGVVKLVDFGVAKATAQLERTKAGVVKGKFRYMSPEQLQLQDLDGRSDLFSVGVLLYEMSTGLKPFERPQVIEIIRALTTWNPPAPAKAIPGYPKPISDVIERALSKNREQRFSDGTQMKLALEKALAAIPNPTDVQTFVSQFLPPPIAVPPPIPEAALAGVRSPSPPKEVRRTPDRVGQLLELGEDGEDDSATMMGLPVFDAKGRLVRHQSLSAPPADRKSGARKAPAQSAADGDSDDRWDELLPRTKAYGSSASAPLEASADQRGEAHTRTYGSDAGIPNPARESVGQPLASRDQRRMKSPGSAPLMPARTRLPPLSSESAQEDDDEGTVAMRSAPRRGKSQDMAVEALTMKGLPDGQTARSSKSSGSQQRPRRSAEHAPAVSGDARAEEDTTSSVSPLRQERGSPPQGDAHPGSGRRAAPAFPKVSGPKLEASAAQADDDDDDVPPDWRPSRDAAAQISIAEEERLALEDPPASASRRRLPSILLILLALLGAGGALAYVALQKPAEEPVQAEKGKGRIVIDGQGFVSFDGRHCPLPCFRNVEANRPHKIVHGSDPSRFREISVAPDQTIRLTIDEL